MDREQISNADLMYALRSDQIGMAQAIIDLCRIIKGFALLFTGGCVALMVHFNDSPLFLFWLASGVASCALTVWSLIVLPGNTAMLLEGEDEAMRKARMDSWKLPE